MEYRLLKKTIIIVYVLPKTLKNSQKNGKFPIRNKISKIPPI